MDTIHSQPLAVVKTLALTVGFSTAIALFITAVGFGAGLKVNFVVSQCMGLSICGCILLAHLLLDLTAPAIHLLAVGVAMLAGTGIGAGLSAVATGMDPSVMDSPVGFLKLMLMGLVFGTIISYFFISRHTIASSQAAAREERIRRLTSENMATEARLRLLQAQIEPHFLFNVLSHVLSLLDTNPQAGKAMLGDLIAYLRRSFSQMRQQQSTLGQEMALIEAYLNLFKVRMGQRLDFKLEMDEKLGQVPFPPLLLQPLVENAVRHGLEPRIEGGRLMIRAENGPRGLRIEVADSGGGLSPASRPGGGLANVRERLESLYGENGRLILEENHPRGLKAIIEVPHGSA